jgi:phosphinothricin acetyltransferase
MTGRTGLRPAPTEASDESRFVLVRPAVEQDIAAVRCIYAHHVLNGTGSFEESAPDVDEMSARFRSVTGRDLPFLVAEAEGAVRGFAYAAPFRSRSAYRFTVEDSVYVDPDAVGRGLGRQLLAELIERCREKGLRQMVAVIGDSDNQRSIALHAALGFRRAGTLQKVGCKFGRSLDVVFMQRPLGDDLATS